MERKRKRERLIAPEQPLALLLYLKNEYNFELISMLQTVEYAYLWGNLKAIPVERYSISQWNGAIYYLFNEDRMFQTHEEIRTYLQQ